MNQILLGDCLDVLKGLPDNSVDSVITDPPYGLGTKEPTVDEIVLYLQGGGLDTGGDFMGNAWDIPSVAVWREVFRVLKPGGHVLSFGGTRTYDLISLGLRAAGFENRDTIASQLGVTVLQWIQGQGFPKSLNVQKALEKAGLTPEESAEWSGWGTALKPSWEPILVFRKPIAESTVAKQVVATGTGALNIDACRVGTQDDLNGGVYRNSAEGEKGAILPLVPGSRIGQYKQPTGRWPSNLFLTHTDQCKRVGTKRVDAPVINRFTDGAKPFGGGAGHAYESEQRGDADGKEEIPVYECAEGCPVKVLDEQSGELKSGGGDKGNKKDGMGYRKGGHYVEQPYNGDSGGASRFFPQFEPLEAPFLYQSKVSKRERDAGLPKGTNLHPTVKPQALMQWLIRLVTPPGGTVLDPYCGSGSTPLAAARLGFGYVAIERDPQYHDVAVRRLATVKANLVDQLEELSEDE